MATAWDPHLPGQQVILSWASSCADQCGRAWGPQLDRYPGRAGPAAPLSALFLSGDVSGPQSHSSESMKRKLYLETESKGPWGHHLRSPRVSFHTLEQEITAFISYMRDFKGPEPISRCKHSTWNPNQYGLTSGYIFPQPREFSVTCIGSC